MIVFVQPMFSRAELNSDSNYVLISSLLRSMRKVRPDWHFVMPFPDKNSGFKYDDDGLFSQSNITRIPQRINPRRHGGAVHYDSIWYDKLLKKLAIDVIWCNLVESAGNLKHAGDATYNDTFKPVVIAHHHYVIHESLPYPLEAMENIMWAQITGAAIADCNIFHSEHCKNMFMDNTANLLSQEQRDNIKSKSRSIHLGVLEPSLGVSYDVNTTVPVIVYNHRLQGYKNWRVTFEVLDELYKEGIQFKVKFTSSTRENLAHIMKYPFVEVALGATREEYLENIKGCDLNVTNSSHETFCISAVESMAYGQPLVAPDGVTFPEITGRDSNAYPYLFKNRNEQKDMLRKLLTDHAERQKWGNILSDHVLTNFNHTVWAERMAELFEEHDANVVVNVRADDAKDMFIGKMHEFDRKPFQDFYRAVCSTAVNGRTPFGQQSLPYSKASRLVRRLGGFVAMVGGKQLVVAPK